MAKANFEDNMENLEKIVTELEKGDLNLDESISKFEEGIKISKQCNKILEDAEKKITILLEKDGEVKEENFVSEAGLEITNYEGSYFLINYNTYEVIDTKGYNKSDDEILYKLTDINKKDDENTTSENDNVIEETTEKNNENEKNDEG